MYRNQSGDGTDAELPVWVGCTSRFTELDKKSSRWQIGAFVAFMLIFLSFGFLLQRYTARAIEPIGGPRWQVAKEEPAAMPAVILQKTLVRTSGYFLQDFAARAIESIGGSTRRAVKMKPAETKQATNAIRQGALVAWLGSVFAYLILSIGAFFFTLRIASSFRETYFRDAPSLKPLSGEEKPSVKRKCADMARPRFKPLPLAGSWSLLILFLVGVVVSLSMTGKLFMSQSMLAMHKQEFGLEVSLNSIMRVHNAARDGTLLVLMGLCCQSLLVFGRTKKEQRHLIKLESEPHFRLLGMQFRRHTHLLYMGSLLLVVGMIEIILWINLFIECSVNPSVGLTRPIVRAALSTYSFPIGVSLSLLLLSGYAFGTTALVRQTKTLFRSLEVTPMQRKRLLEHYGMSDSILYGAKRVLVLLGPSILGGVGTYLLRVL